EEMFFDFTLDKVEQLVLKIMSIERLNLHDNFTLFDAKINIILPAKIILFDSNPHNHNQPFSFSIIQKVSIRNLNYSGSSLYIFISNKLSFLYSAISINYQIFGKFEYYIVDVDFKYVKDKIVTIFSPFKAVKDVLAEYNPIIYYLWDENVPIFNDNYKGKEKVDAQFCKYKYHQINYSDNYIGMLLTIK
ncbi:hypothetical protein HZS_4968, partial [Henneguya salminicola]